MANDLIRKTISLSPVHVKMLKDLITWEGATSESDIIRRAISEMYRTLQPKPIPAYAKILAERDKRKRLTPEERVNENMRMENLRKELRAHTELEAGEKIAKELYRSKIIKESDGSFLCEFPTYAMTIPGHIEIGEMRVPFSQLTEDTLANQFEGNREAIIKILEDREASTNGETK